MIDEHLRTELQPYIRYLVELGLRTYEAENFYTKSLFQHADTYNHLVQISLDFLNDLNLSDDARFSVSANFDFYLRVESGELKGELRRILRSYWVQISEIYRKTPSFDFRRKRDVCREQSQTKWHLPMYLQKEFTAKNKERLLDLIRDQNNGWSREVLLFTLERRKRGKWVQDFLVEIQDDPEIGLLAREIMIKQA